MRERSHNMKPQDVVILFKILTFRGQSWNQLRLSAELGISQSEISEALHRLHYAGLFSISRGTVNREGFFDFIINGLKYVFPQRPGPIVRGVPTAHSAPVLKDQLFSEEQYVWPYSKGQARGQAITPLYRTVPAAVERDEELYDLLALADVMRVGRSRERELALKLLQQRFGYA